MSLTSKSEPHHILGRVKGSNTMTRKQEYLEGLPPVPSHATVLQTKTHNGYGVVLCDLGFNEFSPTKKEFVTWTFRVGDTGVGSGHYFYCIVEAAKDFNKR